MMPLTLIPIGTTVTILKLSGKEDMVRHLSNLGFIVGDKITVINSLNGDVIVQVKDARVALNQDIAKHIMVQ